MWSTQPSRATAPHGPGLMARLAVCVGSCVAGTALGLAPPEVLAAIPAVAELDGSPASRTERPAVGAPEVARRAAREVSRGGASSLGPHRPTHAPVHRGQGTSDAGPPSAHPDPLARRFADGMVVTGRTPHRLLLFTFDDGPHPRHTPRLLDVLDRYGVRAVFFLTADRIRPDSRWGARMSEIAREIAARGHLVGDHTVDHAQLPALTNASVVAQLEASNQIFERVFGGRPWLFRPPGGSRSDRVDRLIAERGYTQVLWNLGAPDHEVRTAQEIARSWRRTLDRREREGQGGGVVLLHDTHEWTVDAVPRIFDDIRARNCKLLERGEELYDIVADPQFFYMPRATAPPNVEAPPAMPDPDVLALRQERLREETAQRCGRLAVR